MTLTLNEYQQLSARTRRGDLSKRDATNNAVLGLAEVYEITELWKKHLYQGHDWNSEKVAEELGDLLFYMAWLAAEIDYTLEDVALNNLNKLAKRYPGPEGFSVERSINREEVIA